MPRVQELSKQPIVLRDLALWVDADVTVQSMFDTVAKTISTHVELAVVQDVRIFDVWRDKRDDKTSSEKSLAFRFWLQDTDKTLDDVRVDACMTVLRDALIANHSARQRT